MKNIVLLLVTIPLLLISCTRDPFADFTVSTSNAAIGETIYFTNLSIDAESFEWDFGDGFLSNSFNVSHNYDSDGVYTVRLKAFTKGQTDVAIKTITVSRNLISDFIISDNWVGAGENVLFTNLSKDAESYEWDFGDGYTSNNFNTSHYYSQTGEYTVILKAIYQGFQDISSINISVGASLNITVEEYLTPYYLVTDISVILYPSLTDWENQTNMIEERFTNNNGVVRFDHLYNQRYYVDVYGPNHDNYKLKAEDVGWIETPVLVGGIVNAFTAVVDYYPPAKKSTLARQDLKSFRKIEAESNSAKRKAEVR